MNSICTSDWGAFWVFFDVNCIFKACKMYKKTFITWTWRLLNVFLIQWEMNYLKDLSACVNCRFLSLEFWDMSEQEMISTQTGVWWVTRNFKETFFWITSLSQYTLPYYNKRALITCNWLMSQKLKLNRLKENMHQYITQEGKYIIKDSLSIKWFTSQKLSNNDLHSLKCLCLLFKWLQCVPTTNSIVWCLFIDRLDVLWVSPLWGVSSQDRWPSAIALLF